MKSYKKFDIIIGILGILLLVAILAFAIIYFVDKGNRGSHILDVDVGTNTTLNIPRSNLISDKIDITRDIKGENGTLHIDIRLPQINIDNEYARSINDEIYKKYQDIYKYVTEIEKDNTIKIDYSYEYTNNDSAVKITITEEETGKENVVTEYIYDLINNVKIYME